MVILRHDLPKRSERANVAENAGAGTTFGRTAGDGIRLPLLIPSSLHSHANRVAEFSQKEVKDYTKEGIICDSRLTFHKDADIFFSLQRKDQQSSLK